MSHTHADDGIQRTDEWRNLDEVSYRYHLSQWESPKESTKAVEAFIRDPLVRSRAVIDIGSGSGAATAYVATRHHGNSFVGVDYSAELVSIGNALARKQNLGNLRFEVGDWFNLAPRSGIDGVLSLQTLSWLPEFERPLQQLFEKIAPRWIAMTSLFYEGDISCRIEVVEHKRDSRKSFYNVYSLPSIRRFCATFGYDVTRFVPFEIGIDIPRPSDIDLMGTYTLRVSEDRGHAERRVQISGPLLMNWYMILIEKCP